MHGRIKDPFIDFVGLFVDRGQAGLADTHISIDANGDALEIKSDANTNVQAISLEFDQDEDRPRWAKATFARSAITRDEANDHEVKLDGCNVGMGETGMERSVETAL